MNPEAISRENFDKLMDGFGERQRALYDRYGFDAVMAAVYSVGATGVTTFINGTIVDVYEFEEKL